MQTAWLSPPTEFKQALSQAFLKINKKALCSSYKVRDLMGTQTSKSNDLDSRIHLFWIQDLALVMCWNTHPHPREEMKKCLCFGFC